LTKQELQFEPNGEITGMTSVEGERIPWVESVSPARIGAVERWLLEVRTAAVCCLYETHI
jgi:hypothetical protein